MNKEKHHQENTTHESCKLISLLMLQLEKLQILAMKSAYKTKVQPLIQNKMLYLSYLQMIIVIKKAIDSFITKVTETWSMHLMDGRVVTVFNRCLNPLWNRHSV